MTFVEGFAVGFVVGVALTGAMCAIIIRRVVPREVERAWRELELATCTCGGIGRPDGAALAAFRAVPLGQAVIGAWGGDNEGTRTDRSPLTVQAGT